MTGPGGTPMCKYAAISWTDDQSVLPCGPHLANPYYGANVCLVNLNAPSSTPPFYINEQTYAPYVTADVAAVETHTGGGGYYVSYLALSDIGGNLREWEVDDLNGVPSPLTPNYLAGGKDPFPRIAAIDDSAINDYSASGTDNVWLIVDNTTSSPTVWGYYGLAASIFSVSLAGVWSVNSVFPRVAFGVDEYTVTYDLEDGYDSYISTNLAWNATMVTPTVYDRINYTGIGTGSQQNAIACTCNNDGSFYWSNPAYLFACWYNNSPVSDVYYKEALGIGAWKHANTAALNNINTTNAWRLWPNPASDHIMLAMPEGTEKGTYSISDITGMELMSASMNNNTEELYIGRLKPGMYMIHLYENPKGTGGNEVKVLKFVKE